MIRSDTTLHVNGLDLHVVEWSARERNPDAVTVVMLHGIRGYADTFDGLARHLQPGYRVVAFDQRGRGESEWDLERQYYTDTYMADLARVVRLLGVGRFVLLGHSMGGSTALAYAAAHPEQVIALVIEDAGPGAFENSPGATRIQQELASTPERFDNWEAASSYMRGLRPSVTEAARQQRLHNMLKPIGDGRYTWRYDQAGIAATRLNPDPRRLADLTACVREIRCPLLVLRGDRSDYLQPEMVEDMQRLNPRMRYVEIPGAGHYIHDDQPDVFNGVVRDFLQTVTTAEAT